MERRLGDVARLVRSKNAGPFWLTFDVMFESDGLYRAVRDSEVLGRAAVLALYPQDPALVKVFNCDAALAIKASFPRPHSSGSPLDSDHFGGSQYAPLLDLIVEI
ncbi:MAG: DUF4387 domain-containing protein [Candidatus Dormibacteraceae bacterium]